MYLWNGSTIIFPISSHHELIILSLLVDTRIEKRSLGVKLIIKARNRPPSADGKVRFFNKEFKLKILNFGAKDYDEMLGDLEAIEDITEPPCTMKLDEHELKKIESGEKKLEIGNVLCHSTHCERGVAMTTKAAEKYCGYQARHGYIISKHQSMKSFGKNLTKAEVLQLKHDFEANEMDTS